MQKRSKKAIALSLTGIIAGCNIAPVLATNNEKEGKSITVSAKKTTINEKKGKSERLKQELMKREKNKEDNEKEKQAEAKKQKEEERKKELHYVDINGGVIPKNPRINVSLLAENENISIVDTELLKTINNSLGRGYVTEPVTEADMLSLVYLITPDDSKLNNIRSLSGLEYAKNLEVLDVEVSYLQDGIANIKDLNKLTFLQLDNAGVNQDELAIIGGLTNLKWLSLQYNYVTDTSIFKDLTNLECLNLDGNYTLTDLSTLSTLTTLTDLSIVSASLSDISFLSGMTNLEHLNLSRNYRIKDINVIGELSNLTHLTINELDNLNDISPLASLTKLEYLDLKGNFSISNCTPISNLTNLKHLDVGNIGNLRDISFMSSLINLKEIGLRGTPVKDLAPLSTLSAITWLDIRSSSITTLDNIDFAPTMDYLSLANTSLLKSTALNKIEKINGDLDLNNSKLDTLYSLINVTEIGGDLILSNCKMSNLFGFYELLKVGGDIDLSYLGSEYTSSILPGFDQFNKLQTVGGTIDFYKSKITELEGFTSLQTVGGSINLNESRLKSLTAFENLQTVEGDLDLYANSTYGDLSNINSIKNIEKIGGVLNLGKTPLTEIPELANLKELGGLNIEGTDIMDISLLSKFTTFKGDINLSNTNIVDFSPLSNITSIEGDLYLNHTKIENLDMLSNLTSINSLYAYTTNISNLNGLRNLRTIKGDLDFLSLPKLENVDGLKGLKTVGGYLSLNSTPIKNIDGLSDLTYVGKELDLYETELTNVDGLANLEYVGDYLDLEDTITLKNIDGFSKLKTVGDYIDLEYTSITDVNGLSSLESIGDGLFLDFTYVSNVEGLKNLKTVGQRLSLSNTYISNIVGLENLQTVRDTIYLNNCFLDVNDTSLKAKLKELEDNGTYVEAYNNQYTLKTTLAKDTVLPSKSVSILDSLYSTDSTSKNKPIQKDILGSYLEYTVEDDSIVSVDKKGVVSFLKEGSTNVEVQFKNSPHTKVIIPIEAKKDIESIDITLGEDKETVTLTSEGVNMRSVSKSNIDDLTFSNKNWLISEGKMKSESLTSGINTTKNECKFNAKSGDVLSFNLSLDGGYSDKGSIYLNDILIYEGAYLDTINLQTYLYEGENTLRFEYTKDYWSGDKGKKTMDITDFSITNYGDILPLDKIEYHLIDEKVREGEVEWLEYTTPFKIDKGTTIEARGVSGEVVGDISTYTLSNGAKPVITAEDRVLKVSDTFNILEGVSATDEEDGPIAIDKIKYVSDVKVGVVGDYTVTYTVEDNDKNVTTKTINVKIEADEVVPPLDEEKPPIDEVVPPVDDTKPPTDTEKPTVDDTKPPTDEEDKKPVEDDKKPTEEEDKTPITNEKPTISANDKVIEIGALFNPLENVTAYDKEDGNLTDKIKIDKNTVEINKEGIYEVTYSVEDSAKNKVTKTIKVEVIKTVVDEVVVDEKPIIIASDKVIELGSKVDLLEGVSATDKEDGNLTDKVIIKESNVDLFKEGVYDLTYSVKDSKGNETLKTIKVQVVKTDITVDEKVTVTITASDKTILVGDTFNPLEGVVAKDSNGNDLTDKLEVIKNNVDTTKEGEYEVAYKIDLKGNEFTKTTKITVKLASNPTQNEDSNKDTDKENTQAQDTNDNKNTQSTDKEVVKTNDSIMTYFATMFGSLVSSVLIFLRLRRKK